MVNGCWLWVENGKKTKEIKKTRTEKRWKMRMIMRIMDRKWVFGFLKREKNEPKRRHEHY